MQLDQSCLLDLFGQYLSRSPLTDPFDGYARGSLLVLPKNLLRNHFLPNSIVPANRSIGINILRSSSGRNPWLS